VSAGVAGFGEAPHVAQLVFLLAVSVFAAAFYSNDLHVCGD